MDIFVNGERFEVPSDTNVTNVLAFLNIPLDRVAVEMNKTLVRKRDWSTTSVLLEAHLEIVEFVGGG